MMAKEVGDEQAATDFNLGIAAMSFEYTHMIPLNTIKRADVGHWRYDMRRRTE
jgi:hypothetical protein